MVEGRGLGGAGGSGWVAESSPGGTGTAEGWRLLRARGLQQSDAGKEAERLEMSSARHTAAGDRHSAARDKLERSGLRGVFPFSAGDPQIPERCHSASLIRSILLALLLLQDNQLSAAGFPLRVAKFCALGPGSPAPQKTIGSQVTELFSVRFFRNAFVQVTC